MSKGLKDLLTEANAVVDQISAYEAIKLLERDDILFVDLREWGELEREGKIPGALHIPRGVFEFHFAADSPLHNPALDTDKKLVFYCASGGRSALAGLSAHRLGLAQPAHVEGGFGAWKAAGGPVDPA